MQTRIRSIVLTFTILVIVIAVTGWFFTSKQPPGEKKGKAVSLNTLSGEQVQTGAETKGPYVIFKFDDLNDKGVPWQGFKAITDICKEKGAKCTMGIFGQSLERGDPAYFDYLRSIVNDPDIEIWMHGYNGNRDELLGNLTYQKWAFAKTRWNLLYYLDYLPRTFSPHWDSGDTLTVKAFLADSLYLNWPLFPPKGSFKGLLNNSCQLETGDKHYPDSLSMLKTHYDSCAAKMDYFICQGHPWNWDAKARDTFSKYLDYIKSKGARFATFYGYYKIINHINDSTPPSVPQGLMVTRKNVQSIVLSWKPSNDPETKVDAYKIYRSGRFIDITMGTSYTDLTKDNLSDTVKYQVSAINRANLSSDKSAAVLLKTAK
jgi:peptidoglycan/xylan/chitin deacetylase (PgdA/CDA1 family)